MADVTIVAADVRPLEGCVIRRLTAGEALTFGVPVYLSAANTVIKADASTVAGACAIGVVVSGALGNSSVASGEECDVVVFGPVAGYSTNMAFGAKFYIDDDAGVIADAAGTKSTILGVGLSGSVLLVNPIYVGLA